MSLSQPRLGRETHLWALYDALTASIPEEDPVDEFVAGLHWFGLRSGQNMGLSMTPPEQGSSISFAGEARELSLRRAAALAKSWNHAEAALGVAAINAHWNTPSRLRALAQDPALLMHSTGQNAFEMMMPRLKGKVVTVVGHFRGLDKLREHCELHILERRPQPGDLPDPACEDVLPRSDFVFITGTTLVNKTLPRLLKLSQQAFITVVGPTTPLSPVLFDFGVDLIAGLLVEKPAPVWRIIQEGGQHKLFGSGTQMLQFERAGAYEAKQQAT